MLNGDIDAGLFKDIVEEEFDLDGDALGGDITIEETDLESPLLAAKEAIAKATMGKKNGPSKDGRFFIETVLEGDEDEASDEESPLKQRRRQSTIKKPKSETPSPAKEGEN